MRMRSRYGGPVCPPPPFAVGRENLWDSHTQKKLKTHPPTLQINVKMYMFSYSTDKRDSIYMEVL